MNVINLIQITKYKWELRSIKGHLLIEEKTFGTKMEAIKWAENYISSWTTWKLNVITMLEVV
jgi:hypothetical protein